MIQLCCRKFKPSKLMMFKLWNWIASNFKLLEWKFYHAMVKNRPVSSNFHPFHNGLFYLFVLKLNSMIENENLASAKFKWFHSIPILSKASWIVPFYLRFFFFTVIKMVPSSFLIYQTPPPSITLEAILLFLLESYKCDCVYRTILLQQCSALEIRDFIINYYYHK